VSEPERDNPVIVRTLVEHGAEVRFVTELRHSLEEVYLNLIHSAAGEEGASR
jgi:ABC-2 type transport system ATP-binding protein